MAWLGLFSILKGCIEDFRGAPMKYLRRQAEMWTFWLAIAGLTLISGALHPYYGYFALSCGVVLSLVDVYQNRLVRKRREAYASQVTPAGPLRK